MFTAYDKAAAAALASALTAVISALTPLDAEVVGALGTLITAGLVWLVPNRKGATK